MNPVFNTLFLGYALGAAALAGQQAAQPSPFGRKRQLETAGDDVRAASPPRKSLLRQLHEDEEEQERVCMLATNEVLLLKRFSKSTSLVQLRAHISTSGCKRVWSMQGMLSSAHLAGLKLDGVCSLSRMTCLCGM